MDLLERHGAELVSATVVNLDRPAARAPLLGRAFGEVALQTMREAPIPLFLGQ